VIIAHRMSTIKVAHRIAVLERGHIIELGAHEELMGRKGLYTRLYSMQFRDPEEELAGLRVKLHGKQADGNPRNAPSLRIPSPPV
jgi:ABC-type methionine transport system ATPase subunit